MPVYMSMNNNRNGKITFFKDLFMNTGANIEVNGNDIIMDGGDIILDSTGTNFINADAAGIDIHSDGSGDSIGLIVDGVTYSFRATGLQLGLTADLDMSFRALQFTPTTSTFLLDGAMYYNSTLNQFEVREDGNTKTITGGGASNLISQGDSSVIVTDVGTGIINFAVDGIGIGSVTTGLGWVLENDLTLTSGDLKLINGFAIQNTSASITTLNVPSGEDLIFAEAGTEVARYDGGNNNWVFNPANDVQLSPDTDVDLTPVEDIIMNPGGDIRVFADLDMDGSNTIDFGTSASVPPGSAIGAIQIKINGIIRLVKFYST